MLTYISRLGAVLGLGLGLIAFGANRAEAQGVCPMGQPGPTPVASTSYTIGNKDQCAFLLFTASTPVSVTVPSAASLQNPHFMVRIMSTGAPLTVTSTVSPLNQQSQPATINGYAPLDLAADGTNYWLVAITPQQLSGPTGQPLYNPSSTTSVMPGTTFDGSVIYSIGNGVVKFGNQASWQRGSSPPWLGSTVCTGAPQGYSQPGSAWLRVLDNFGVTRYIPTC